MPLVPCEKWVWASPRRVIGTPVQGGYRRTPRSCLPLEGFLLVPLPLDLIAYLPPVFYPLVSCVYSV